MRHMNLDRKKEIGCFAIILLIGILARCLLFGSLPGGVNQDEAMGAVDAWALSKYGTDRFGVRLPVHFSAWQVSQMSVLLSYLMVPFLKAGGLQTAAVRLPMLLVSCGSLVLIYLVGKKLFSPRMGLLFMALTAVNPWHFMQSRWSLDCNLFPHVFLLGFYLMLLGLEKGRWRLYLSMVFFGLTFYCYGIAVYAVLPFLAVFALWCLFKRLLKFWQVCLCALIFGLVALPELLVMAINLFHWETVETPLFTMSRFPETVRGNDILFMNFSFGQLFRNLWALVSQVFLQLPDFVLNALPAFGPMYHISLPFMVAGILNFTRELFREEDILKKTCYLALWGFFLMGIWVGIVTYEVNVNRVNIIFYPLIMLCGYGIARFVRIMGEGRWVKRVLGAAYGLCAAGFFFCYFTDFKEESRVYYNVDFLEAVKAADAAEGTDALYITGNMGWQFNREMAEILTQYACQIDALYFQGQTDVTGGRTLASYRERYHFVDMRTLDGQEPEWGESLLFLVHEEDLASLTFPFREVDRRGPFLILKPDMER